jgi:hypothetical protein
MTSGNEPRNERQQPASDDPAPEYSAESVINGIYAQADERVAYSGIQRVGLYSKERKQEGCQPVAAVNDCPQFQGLRKVFLFPSGQERQDKEYFRYTVGNGR